MTPIVVRVYVSSTWEDLQRERQAVEHALQQMRETKFVGMEYFGSRGEDARQGSLDELDRSDVYIGILGERFGSGITAAEYRRARDRGMPRFLYHKRIEDGRANDPDLEALKAEQRAGHLIRPPFTSPDQLAVYVISDLHRWLFDEYLAPRLERAAEGSADRAEAIALLAAIRDPDALDPHLRTRLWDAGLVPIEDGRAVASRAPRDRMAGEPTTGAEWEKRYLRWLVGEVETISKQWHRLPIEPTPAHTKEPQGQQGWRAWCRARLYRYSQSDYDRNPALKDLDLAIRAGFGRRVRIKNLAKELRNYTKIVVLGDPGSGKSVCLRQLAADLAGKALQGNRRPATLPVLVVMDTYEGWADREARHPTPVLELLEQHLRSHPSVRQDPKGHPLLDLADNLEALLREGRLTCIFDALDEMPQDSYQERCQELKQFMSYWERANTQNRFIFSCRSLDYDPAFNVDEVIIDPFDRGRIRRFLRHNLPAEAADALYDRIVEDESLEEIVSNPFFLQALAYINAQAARGRYRIPTTRGELIRDFVETLLAREAEQKQHEDLVRAGGRAVLTRFLGEVGFALQQRREGGTSARVDALGDVWARYPAWRELLRIARRARILGKRGEEADERVDTDPPRLIPPDRVEFVHHRTQEYFAASMLARQLEQGEPIEQYLEDIWWQETVILAVGTVQDPRPLLGRMLAPRPEVDAWVRRAGALARDPIPIEAIRVAP
jgi:hypothetical protein